MCATTMKIQLNINSQNCSILTTMFFLQSKLHGTYSQIADSAGEWRLQTRKKKYRSHAYTLLYKSWSSNNRKARGSIELCVQWYKRYTFLLTYRWGKHMHSLVVKQHYRKKKKK